MKTLWTKPILQNKNQPDKLKLEFEKTRKKINVHLFLSLFHDLYLSNSVHDALVKCAVRVPEKTSLISFLCRHDG